MKRTFSSFCLSLVIALVIALAFAGCATPQKPDPAAEAGKDDVWTLKDVKNPESAYYDVKTGVLFVSNVAGNPGEKDGKGWITRLDPNGKVLDAQWVSGLNAPKGMRAYNGVLYVTDIDQVISIDIVHGKILNRVKIKDAKFLNDIAITSKGTVYVSDMLGNKIYSVRNNHAKVFMEGSRLEGPNGLYALPGRLIVAAWGTDIKPDFSTSEPGRLYEIDLGTQKISSITYGPVGNLDGLEMDKAGNYLVSDWVAGKVFKISPKGEVRTILSGFKGSADIGYIPDSTTLIVPRMMEDRVTAYQLTAEHP